MDSLKIKLTGEQQDEATESRKLTTELKSKKNSTMSQKVKSQAVKEKCIFPGSEKLVSGLKLIFKNV